MIVVQYITKVHLCASPLTSVGGAVASCRVSALVSGSSGPGLSPGLEHCVVFLSKTLYSHGASLQPGV